MIDESAPPDDEGEDLFYALILERDSALLEKLVESFPNAWNVAAVRQFLDDMDPTRILYFKKEEAGNFDRWMLQWVAIETRERDARRGLNDE